MKIFHRVLFYIKMVILFQNVCWGDLFQMVNCILNAPKVSCTDVLKERNITSPSGSGIVDMF